MHRSCLALLLTGLCAAPLRAQHPLRHSVDAMELRFAQSQPVVRYTLQIDSTDLSAFAVEMRLRNTRDTFHLAMAVHPEYDDRYYRFVEGPTITARDGPATITREDSTLWRVRVPAGGGELVVWYRLRLPPRAEGARAAWQPVLTPTGGLVGGMHSFLYLVGAELAPAHVTLVLPAGWDIATGLPPTSDARTFFAPSVDVLMDSPFLVGRLRTWRFAVDGVPHRVAYWPLPDATPFDTTHLVDAVAGIVRETVALFGRAPYREYDFLLQDDAYGALEHWNSVTLGAPSAVLARDPADLLMEIAHEYVHAWNLMRIRPREYHGVDYRPPVRTHELWWSEGITIYYSDLLLRRAGLPVRDSTRTGRLAAAMSRYLSRSGYARLAPESVSAVAYGAPPGSLGDYSLSVHLVGEILGAMLDLEIRGATAGRRSLDDVMRLLLERFSGVQGFTGTDLEHVVGEVCACAMQPFFDRYVRTGHAMDFDRYLGLVGMRAHVTWMPARDSAGRPLPDIRLFAWESPGAGRVSLLLGDPGTAWGRAGLHTGDRVISFAGTPVTSWSAFRRALIGLRIGDSVAVVVERNGATVRVTVPVTGYDRPVVAIEAMPDASPAQQALRARWLAAQ